MRYTSESRPEISLHSMRLIREKAKPCMIEVGGNVGQYGIIECYNELKEEDKNLYKKDIATLKQLLKEGVSTIEI